MTSKARLGFIVSGFVLVASAAASHAQQGTGTGGSTTSPVKVKISPALIAKANSPTPGANATKKTSIGKGKLKVNTSNGPNDDDSFWVEQIDVDGNGDMEDTNLIWDDEDKVLYYYDDSDSLSCTNGGTATADLLVAVNGQGNPRNRPAGSGFYVVSLDESECKVEAAGTYGCKFDATGTPTACGLAMVDEKNDDILFVPASK